MATTRLRRQLFVAACTVAVWSAAVGVSVASAGHERTDHRRPATSRNDPTQPKPSRP